MAAPVLCLLSLLLCSAWQGMQAANISIGALFTFDSVIGRSAKTAIELAVADVNRDAAVLNGTYLTVEEQDTKCSGFVGIIQGLQLMEKKVVAVVGPQSSGIAHVVSHVVDELRIPLLSFAATDPTLASSQYPYFLRATYSDLSQMAAVADLVTHYGWREVTVIYVDTDYGRAALDALGDELEAKRSKVSYRAPFPPAADRAAIADLLLRVSMMESRVIVVHASPDSGLDIFAAAQSLGMMASGYVWIATEWLAAVLDSSPRKTALLQGVVTLRQYTPDSDAKRSLMKRFAARLQGDKNQSAMNAYGLFAYDAVWMAARAIDQLLGDGSNVSFSDDTRLRADNETGSTLRLGALKVFDQGEQLLSKMTVVNFTGVTGRVQFGADRSLADPAYEVLNVGGTGVRRVGYWSNRTRLSVAAPGSGETKKQELHSVIWPGETAATPRGWVFPNNGKPLRIGVPYRTTYRQFVSKDSGPDGVSGYCVDVFKAAVALLPYPVAVAYVVVGDGVKNPSYGELVQRVAEGELDAAVGDISIVTNRTRVVDFTQPYVESGLVIVTAVREKASSAWAFLKPFTAEMWAVTGGFFLFVGAVVWVLEHRSNADFRGSPRKQLVTVFWFSFSTMFFAHRENTVSTLGRLVLIIWLFVVLIINSSYTASLTSILTVQQLSTGIQGLDGLIASSDPIGFQVGSFAKSYLMQELGVPESRLRELAITDYASSLQNGAVAAIVDELPYVELFLSTNCQFRTVGQEFTKSGWGFVSRSITSSSSSSPSSIRAWLTHNGAGVPARLPSGRGPVDGDPDAVGERRPAEDPRQVAEPGAVRVAGRRRRRRPPQPQQLLGPLPHLRHRLPHRAAHLLLQDAAPVLQVPWPRRRRGGEGVPGGGREDERAAAGAAGEHPGPDDVRGHEGGGGEAEEEDGRRQQQRAAAGQVHAGLLRLRRAFLIILASLAKACCHPLIFFPPALTIS